MAGPCFKIYYENDTILSKESVQKLLQKITSIKEFENGWEFFLKTSIMPGYKNGKVKEKSSGLMLLTQNSEYQNCCEEEKFALVKGLGFVPKFSWTGSAMCKDDEDIDGLYFLMDMLANEAGGYQKVENIPDRLPNDEPDCFAKIEYRDYAAYFGPKEKEISTEDKLKYHDFVEPKSYYMVDLSKTSFSNLDY